MAQKLWRRVIEHVGEIWEPEQGQKLEPVPAEPVFNNDTMWKEPEQQDCGRIRRYNSLFAWKLPLNKIS